MNKQQGGVLNKPFDRKEIYETLHEEIADTYLKTQGMKAKAREQAKKRVSWLPWAVASAAIVACVILLVSKSNIDINIRVLGEVPSVETANSEERFYNTGEKGVYLLKGSEVNNLLVRNTSFLGDAQTYSRIVGGQIVLCNSKGSGWANYSIEFSEPIDLKKLDIRFTARGEIGGEALSIVVVDMDNRSYRIDKTRSITLTREWEAYSVNFRPMKNVIDLKNVAAIRFEFGSLTVGNGSVATMYLKDIYAAKTKRIKWL